MKKPSYVYLEVTNRCNLQCPGCYRFGEGTYHEGDMSLELAENAIRMTATEAPGVELVMYVHGEPMLHPRLPEILDLMIKHQVRGYFATNGTIDRPDIFEKMEENPGIFYELVISIDAMSREGIEKYQPGRSGKNREIALRLIERRKLNIIPKITWSGQPWAEVTEYIYYWLNLGAESVAIGRLLDPSNPGYCSQVTDCNFCEYHNRMMVRWDGAIVKCDHNPKAYTKPDRFYEGSVLIEELPGRLELWPCLECPFPYNGRTLRGTLEGEPTIYFRQDYFNTIYSYKRREPN